MVYINKQWENIKTSEDLKRIISENISPDAAQCVDIIDMKYKDMYEEFIYDYESLQDEYDSLDCECDDLQDRIDDLEDEIKEQKKFFINTIDKLYEDLCKCKEGLNDGRYKSNDKENFS